MRKIISICLVICMIFTLAACGGEKTETPAQDGVTFYDDLGYEVTLTKMPTNVAVLFSSFADIWQTSGGTVNITVGESVERGLCDASVTLVDGGAGKTIDTEALVGAKPDFVICSADIEAQVVASDILRESNIKVACFKVEAFEDYLRVLKIFTDITGREDLYEENGLKVQERISELLSSVKEPESPKKILFIRAGSTSSSTKAKTADEHFAAAMLKEIGTKNIAENAPVLLDGLSLEEIIKENPDYIFISSMGDEEKSKKNIESLFSTKEYQALDAVRNKNYTYLPKDLFQFKPNKNWDKAYEYLIDLVYGEPNS